MQTSKNSTTRMDSNSNNIISRRRRQQRVKRNIMRFVLQLLVWLGMAVIYYFGLSMFFDTPLEYRMKHSTDTLSEQ